MYSLIFLLCPEHVAVVVGSGWIGLPADCERCAYASVGIAVSTFAENEFPLLIASYTQWNLI
jgi:hypothetical protein